MKPFNLLVQYQKLPSINTAHQIGRSGNRVWLYLHNDIKKMQDKIANDLIKAGAVEHFSEYAGNDEIVLEYEIIYVLKENFWKRDVSNLTKHIEDAIAKTIKINDSRNFRISARKVHNDGSNPRIAEEAIVIVVNPTLKHLVKLNLADF